MKAFFLRLKASLLARLLAVLAFGAFLTCWQVCQADREMRTALLEQTLRVGQAVDVNGLRALTGTAEDLKKPEYLRLKDQLAATRDANLQCRFIYLLGQRADGTIFFFVDNEPPDAKDCSPAGQVYEEASAGCHRIFASRAAAVEGPISDRWGTWVSGLVPILDQPPNQPQTGGLIAVLGMDIDARDWNGILARAALPPVLLTLALAALLLLGSILLSRRSLLAGESPRWMHHLEPALAVAVGLALTLFSAWVAHKREAVQRIQAFEQMANSQISRIAGILGDIRDSQLNGLALYCEGNKMSSAADFEKQVSYLTKNPAVQAWAWVPAVPAADKTRFEDAARSAGGMPGFEIWRENWQGLRAPASRRQTYYPIFYLVPLETNEGMLGYDLGSETLLNVAINDAAATGLVTAPDPEIFLQAAGGGKSLLIFRPVFEGEGTKTLRGVALAVLRMDWLLPKAAETSAVFLDLSLLRKNAHPELLASNFPRSRQKAMPISVTIPIFAFGKVVAVTAYPGEGFLRQTGAAWLIALAGLSLTALLAAVLILIHRRQVDP